MKRILSLAVMMVFAANLASFAEVQTTTKNYSTKFVDISVKQPVYTAPSATVPQTEVQKKINETKENVNATKKSITDLKKTWGLK